MAPVSGTTADRLIGLSAAAYRLAVHVLGSPVGAEDVVQEAYLKALTRLRTSPPPSEEQAWFLKVVANVAKDHLRSDARRKRREATVGVGQERDAREPGRGGEMNGAVRAILASLESKYRLPLALCYQENMTQRQAATILEMPERTLSRYVSTGLAKLRKALERAGYPAAVAAVLGGLKSTAPVVPASLAGQVKALVTQGTVKTGTGAAASVSAAAKGGIAMKVVAGIVAAGALAGAVVVSTGAIGGGEETPPANVNPATGRQSREKVFEFTQKPAVKKEGGKYVITFASKGRCDATVAIVDKNGKIVRHLASGILGKNAPWPFKQNSLSQSIEWDGLDDDGKPTPRPCKVKVSLGLKATYERAISFSPANFSEGNRAWIPPVAGFAVAEEGVYIVSGTFQVRLFDHKGEFLRSIAPFPVGLEPGKMKPLAFVKTTDGDRIPINSAGVISTGSYPRSLALQRQGPCLLPDGRLLLAIDKGYQNHALYLGIDGSIAEPKVTSGLLCKAPQDAARGYYFALSADEKTVYLSGGDFSSVVRFSLGGKPDPKPFLGEPGKIGGDAKRFCGPRGIALDKDGNILVSDYGNDRIQVFKPDGSLLRSLKVEGPDCLAVHPETGEIYVTSVRAAGNKKVKQYKPKGMIGIQTTGWTASRWLVKLAPDGTVKASHDLGKSKQIPLFALDTHTEPATVWVSLGREVRLFADRGAAFAPLASPFDTVNRKSLWNCHAEARYGGLFVDRKREELYVDKGAKRFDGKTGAWDPKWKLPFGNCTGYGGEFFLGGPRDMLYLRSGGGGHYVARFDREGKEVPFPNGVVHNYYKLKGVLDFKLGCGCSGNSAGLHVTRKGDVYVCGWGVRRDLPSKDKASIEAFRKKYPWRAGHWSWNGGTHLKTYDDSGKLLNDDVIPMAGYPGGVRVDSGGNVYLAMTVQGAGQKCPLGIDPADPNAGKASADNWGTLMKFPPGKGRMRVDFGSKLKWDYPKTPPTHRWSKLRVWVDDYLWDYPGVSVVVAHDNSCTCPTGRFDLDDFGRAFVPQVHRYSVEVLDPNGNEVLRIGRYGTMANQGAKSPYPEPDIGLTYPNTCAVSDAAVYITDPGNVRIVKAVLSYEAEEEIPLP